MARKAVVEHEDSTESIRIAYNSLQKCNYLPSLYWPVDRPKGRINGQQVTRRAIMSNVVGKAALSPSGAPKIPLRLRLKAWWDGMDLEVCDPGANDAESSDAAEPGDDQRETWETDRVVLLQEMWGQGYSSPGDERFVQKLLAPFGLNDSMAVLDLGAGLGGTTRVIARAGVSRAIGLEADPDLSLAAMEISKAARMATSAPISSFPEAGYTAKKNAYDCIFSKEFMYGVEDKDLLIGALSESLTESGQMQIVDYVTATEGVDSAWLDKWCELDPNKPVLWTRDTYNNTFESQGFRVLMANDISDDISGLVSSSLTEFLANVESESRSPRMLEAMAREIHIWEYRMKLLKEGTVRVYRFHVRKMKSSLG